jgi:molybdopterin converting factor subunit 1
MKIRIRLFASLADRAGGSELSVELPEGITAGELWEAVCREYPALRGGPRPLIAVDLEYVSADRKLDGSEEIALLPPVSGG